MAEMPGTAAPREGGCQKLHKDEEEAALSVPTCPAALQCPRLPWAGDELLWASEGVLSPCWDQTGSQITGTAPVQNGMFR